MSGHPSGKSGQVATAVESVDLLKVHQESSGGMLIELPPEYGIGHAKAAIGQMALQAALVDADWQILAVNDAWIATAGAIEYGALLRIGASYRRYWEFLLMAGAEGAADMLEGLRALSEQEVPYLVHGITTGNEPVRISIMPFKIDGERYATITLVDDGELLRLRRERYQLNANLMRAQTKLLRVQQDERQRVAR